MYFASSKLESQNLTSLTQCSVNSVHFIVTAVGGRDCLSNSGTLASNRQCVHTVYSKPEIHDDISLLISQSLASKQGLLLTVGGHIVLIHYICTARRCMF
jgi:hypothetical protein